MKSYGWTARFYGHAEQLVFGSQLMRARLALLPKLHTATRILILGEGDGRFLSALVEQNPGSTIVVVDRSQRMLARAARRLPEGTTFVHLIQQDATEYLTRLEASERFDAIVTLFVLDCLTPPEVAALVRLATRRLAPGGAWLWGDFFVPLNGPFRFVARLMLTLLYRFFRATTDTTASFLVDTGPHFEAAGLRVAASSSSLCGMVAVRYMVSGRGEPLRT